MRTENPRRGCTVLCKRSKGGQAFSLRPKLGSSSHKEQHPYAPEAIFFSTLRSSTVRSRPFLSTQLPLSRHSRVTSKTHRCARRVQAALPDVAAYRRCIPPEI